MVRVNKLELQTTTRGIKDFTSTFGGGGRHFANAYYDSSHGDQIKQTNYFSKTLFIREQRGFLLI